MKGNRSTNKVRLASFTTGMFDKGAGFLKQTLWYVANACLVRASWNPCMGIKVWLLRRFGARIGRRLVIKNNVNIKFPWKLQVGDDVWLGEGCWIDNLDRVTIANDVCISQGALLLTGNHDYTRSTFDYRNAPIVLEEGVWIGAKAVVCPGVAARSYSILTVGSVATKEMEAGGIYQGNPAVKVRMRKWVAAPPEMNHSNRSTYSEDEKLTTVNGWGKNLSLITRKSIQLPICAERRLYA